MTSSNEVGASEEYSSIASNSLGSGDIGGISGPDGEAARKPSSPVNENMSSAPVLRGMETMATNMISSGGGASA
jgi:hypothetical protein